MQLRPIDIAVGLIVPLIWGMGFVFAKAALEHFPPILLMALRFSVTALVLVWFVKPPWALTGRIFLIALISAAVQYSLTFTGLKGVDASTAILVIQLEVPFIVLLGAVFLGETPSLRRWLGIGIAFIGVAFIAGEPSLADSWLHLLMVLGGAFTWALGQVGGFTMIAWVAVFAAPQLFAFSLLFEEDHLAQIRSADWVVWGAVIYLGLIMTALGYGLWYGLLGRAPASQAAPFLLLLPVFTIIGSVTVLGERLTPQVAGGGAIVIAGLAIILFQRRKKVPEPAL